MTNNRTFVGIACLVGALVLVGIAAYGNSSKPDERLIFSQNQMLGALWQEYKMQYLEPETLRALDKQRDNITTSEGQSYTLLRAVWVGDKKTFDTAWIWTRDILGRKDDRLFSWLFGESADGQYRVLSEKGGGNSASDADSDIALALIFAYARWQDPTYLEAARGILNDLWEKEVMVINGVPYLTANNIEKISSSPYVIVNPSYLSPASYRIFAKVDPAHPWNTLADASYDIIEQSMAAQLDASSKANLPPNWIQVDKQTGKMQAIGIPSLTTHYGYDAFRTPWRLALDYQWFGTPRAKEVLTNMQFLSQVWRSDGKLVAEYTHAGVPITQDEVPAMYGGSIGYFVVSDPTLAVEVYEQKLLRLFDPGANTWASPLSYYDSNWAWFGIALYGEQLPNLAANLTPQQLR